MLILRKLRFKNLFSYGNYFTEIDLDNHDLTVVIGNNGVGKSTLLLDSLCFVLFGKPFRKIKVTKVPLVNSITKKDMLVELEFFIASTNYKVIRGLKPTRFEIYKNDVIIPQDAAKGDYQDYLEEILGCNMKTFCQIVILGSNYIPFLSLSNFDRRVIVEDVLDIMIFTIMNNILKKEIDEVVKSSIDKEQHKRIIIEHLKVYNETFINYETSKNKKIEQYKEDISRLGDEVYKLYEKIKFEKEGLLTKNQVETILESIIECDKRTHKNIQNKTTCSNKINQYSKELEFFKAHKVCPTCQQEIEKEFIIEKIQFLEDQISKFDETRFKIDKMINDNDKIHHEYQMTITNNSKKIKNLEYYEFEIEHLKKNISQFNDSILQEEQIENKITQEIIDKLNEELKNTNNILDGLYKERRVQQSLQILLKDDGIKAQIINQYIDVINELINKFLLEMNFFCSFYLDKNFDEVIKSRYRDEFSYESFSTGQKLRIDLAILFAWREIAKRRNSISINVLIFDEILSSSLDKEGVIDFINILKANKNHENIFLITHDTKAIELVDNIIEIDMNKGFSHINIKKEN